MTFGGIKEALEPWSFLCLHDESDRQQASQSLSNELNPIDLL